jgi:hypothetical protein
VLGRSLVYLNCEVAPLLKGVGEVNPTVNLLVGLLNPPSKATCQAAGILKGGATAANVHAHPAPRREGVAERCRSARPRSATWS